jgi:Chaperone of endosialidase
MPMNDLIRLKTTTSPVLITLALLCFGLLPHNAFGLVPPPDGGYANFTTAEGANALNSLTTGVANTGVGWSSLLSVSTGSFNTGVGAGTLVLNTADSNTATGAAALLLNTVGTENTANGTATLVNNSIGNFNSAFGAFALNNNVDGEDNTAVGASALLSNTTGSDNTAIGKDALVNNTGGSSNTATGFQALFTNANGFDNTANGLQALFSNTGGGSNTAIGEFALFSNTDGGFNTAIGKDALVNNDSGDGNTAVGSEAGIGVTTANNVICIGANVFGADVSNTCFIGNIRDVQTQNADAIPMLIDSAGQLGTASSSQRYKNEIKPMDTASEAILALKPVTFHYKSDTKGIPQFGLIAEDVAKVNPDLVVRDKNGEIYTVRYDAVNAMLLNEFLKEHRKVEEQEATIAQVKKEMETVVARLTEHESKIQKVSAQIEVGKAVGQTALNNP